MDKNDELENLIIKKSSEIGHLQNKIEEQSLLISKLIKLLESSVYEKFQITSSDEIVKKIDYIYEKNLQRHIDPEGLMTFYPQIKNKMMNFIELEKLVQESAEFKLLQKKSQKDSGSNFGF